MYLPGTPNERIGDLRTSKGLQQKELAEMIGISASQLSRIENGETTSINSDTLINLAKALNVSTDYILGLTTLSVPKSYDISELGLSETTVKNLLLIKINGVTPILNHLLAHKSFPALINQMKSYFYEETARGVMGVNQMFGMATSSLDGLKKDMPEMSADINDDIRFINNEKLGKHELDIERIKNTFMAILRDIKKNNNVNENEDAFDMSEIVSQLQAEITGGITPTKERISEVVARVVSEKTGVLDEEGILKLQELSSLMLGFAEEQSDSSETVLDTE